MCKKNSLYHNKQHRNKYTLICIAAGQSQVELIIHAKKLGYNIIAIDQNSNAPGFKFANVKICESTHDAPAIVKHLSILKDQYSIIGILNRSSGPPVITTSLLCEYLNIPGVPVLSAKTIVNKDQLRESCFKFEIPSPKYKIFDVANDNDIACDKYPVVVKPALSLIGKSGITVVRSRNNFESAIQYATENTINNKIILEEFLEGPDLSLVSFVHNRKLKTICLLNEINHENELGLISGQGFKTYISTEDIWWFQAQEIAQTIIEKFNLERSAFMVSFRADLEKNLKLMEIHLDLGGDLLIEELFPRALSIDFVELSVKMATGKINFEDIIEINPTAILYNEGASLITERKCKVFTANSQDKLELLLNE
jgi:formate-dependent phosphoribosylglycinamide formyltransferase (GAR transformylase)